ncbi:hypothetical protein [Mucilaginibacter psychrotolerans]|uniref:Uncharacterized protein n=1 Tax=Mucilaginibacter psychrotolerans TaxID=1524096 RepID=A0A4Y8SB12_9SPHI|nr:hypothetical protein [Mucilaginibacter psychrotolerans]TFF36293.1 hypothetical protein E2R66_15770 [Mucilaginibacter psychrotolerans]
MSRKKTVDQYTPDELAEAFVFPVKLTPEQQTEANIQLNKQRVSHRGLMAGPEKMAKGDSNIVPKTHFASSTDSLLQVIRSKKDADDFMAELDSIIKRAK